MALTRSDKKVMAAAVAVAVVIVGALAGWRILEGQKDAALSDAGPQSAQLGTPPRPANPADAAQPNATGPSQEPNATQTPSQEAQAAPSGQESAQAGPSPQAGSSPQGEAVVQALRLAASLGSNQTNAGPGAVQASNTPQQTQPQAEPNEAAPAQPEQAQPQAPAVVTHAEKKAGGKGGPAGRSSRQEKRGAYRRVVEGVTVTETATELTFTLQGTAGAVRPKVMVFSSPPRLVADFPPDWAYRGGAQPKNPNPLVLSIRSGRTDQRMRIVADLAAMPGGGRPIVGTSPEGIVIRVNKPVKK